MRITLTTLTLLLLHYDAMADKDKAGKVGSKTNLPYNASKAAVVSMFGDARMGQALQFEQACEVEAGWLDQAHDQPGTPAAWPDIPGSEPASPAALASALGLSAQAGPDGPSTLLLRADDDSMRDLGILDGNLLLVDPALVAQPGDIVLVRLDDEYRIRQLCLQDGRLKLLPANPAFSALIPPAGQPLPIWGVVTSVIRRLR